MEANKTYARGLQEIEVAVTKRMRMMGLQRDYICSFMAEAGRVISPAFVDEVASGKIGRSVVPATEAVVREYVLERIYASRLARGLNFDHPTSAWHIHQTLVLSRGDQRKFPFAEGYQTEFKIAFARGEDHLAKYMRAMCAFANAGGGYIFFGIADSGKHSSIDEEAFSSFDWDRFDKLLQNRFSPYFRWDRTLASMPDDEFLVGNDLKGLDTTLIRRVALERGVDAEHLKWLDDGSSSRPDCRVGVIYVWPSEVRIECTSDFKNILRKDVSYVRLRGRNVPLQKGENIPATVKPTSGHRSRPEQDALADFQRRLQAAQAQPQSNQDQQLLL